MPSRAATLPLRSAAVLLMGQALLTSACGKAPDSAAAGTSLADRSSYSSLALPAEGVLVGSEPPQIALGLFGFSEPVEGHFSESVATLLDSPQRQVVTITQTGLPDDSMQDRRIRLDFVPAAETWQVDWVGEQWRCRQGRGSQSWTTERCL